MDRQHQLYDINSNGLVVDILFQYNIKQELIKNKQKLAEQEQELIKNKQKLAEQENELAEQKQMLASETIILAYINRTNTQGIHINNLQSDISALKSHIRALESKLESYSLKSTDINPKEFEFSCSGSNIDPEATLASMVQKGYGMNGATAICILPKSENC